MKLKRNLNEQLSIIKSNELMIQTLNAINVLIIILNVDREIIFTNTAFKKILNLQQDEEALGKKPGEMLGCRYSEDSDEGCGHGPQCANCTVNKILVEVMKDGVTKEGYATITSVIGSMHLTSNFNEKVTEIEIDHHIFYMMALVDKSAELDKGNLERIFFHDILNTASSLHNVLKLLRLENDIYKEDEELKMVESYVKNIIDDIQYHRDISLAEKNNLTIIKEPIDICELISSCIALFTKDEQYKGIHIVYTSIDKHNVVNSDKIILRRGIINLIKNALEASEVGNTVRICDACDEAAITIMDSNSQYIPENIQGRLFNKGYSSKGNGRGIGLYGSQLLVRKYLMGELDFVSNVTDGTTFVITIPKEI